MRLNIVAKKLLNLGMKLVNWIIVFLISCCVVVQTMTILDPSATQNHSKIDTKLHLILSKFSPKASQLSNYRSPKFDCPTHPVFNLIEFLLNYNLIFTINFPWNFHAFDVFPLLSSFNNYQQYPITKFSLRQKLFLVAVSLILHDILMPSTEIWVLVTLVWHSFD
jgi:hypothetical protein